MFKIMILNVFDVFCAMLQKNRLLVVTTNSRLNFKLLPVN